MEILTIRNLDSTEHELYNLISPENVNFCEYKRIPFDNKVQLWNNLLIKDVSSDESIALIVRTKSKIIAYICLVRDDFDSSIFGIDIFRVKNFDIFLDDRLEEIVSLFLDYFYNRCCTNSSIKYLLIGLNANLDTTPKLLNILVKKGFNYIHTLLTYKMEKSDFPNIKLTYDSNVLVREVKEADVESVMELARKSFRFSRFHLDPYLDKSKANLLLETSAKNSILNHFVDIMFVAETEGAVVGYYSAKKKYIESLNLTFGEAVIAAVDEKYRGLNIFKKLNSALLSWFNENTDIAEMGTYLANIPVHKTWSQNGLSIIRGTHQVGLYVD